MALMCGCGRPMGPVAVTCDACFQRSLDELKLAFAAWLSVKDEMPPPIAADGTHEDDDLDEPYDGTRFPHTSL